MELPAPPWREEADDDLEIVDDDDDVDEDYIIDDDDDEIEDDEHAQEDDQTLMEARSYGKKTLPQREERRARIQVRETGHTAFMCFQCCIKAPRCRARMSRPDVAIAENLRSDVKIDEKVAHGLWMIASGAAAAALKRLHLPRAPGERSCLI